jgi:predicted peptidase
MSLSMTKKIILLLLVNVSIISVPNCIVAQDSKIVDTAEYILYLPFGIDPNHKYPLVIALSPGADAQSMIDTWKDVSEKHKWIILASKESRNGMDMKQMANTLITRLKFVSVNYPIDTSRVIATGFSGGGMLSHALTMFYPKFIAAIVVNTGMMEESYGNANSYMFSQNKLAVFLASPTDFRYTAMRKDKWFLEGIGWKTKWIEFEGGHAMAPSRAYEEAAQWLEEQFK